MKTFTTYQNKIEKYILKLIMWLEVSHNPVCEQHCWLYIQYPPLLLSFLKQHLFRCVDSHEHQRRVGSLRPGRVGSWLGPHQIRTDCSVARDRVKRPCEAVRCDAKFAVRGSFTRWASLHLTWCETEDSPFLPPGSCPVWIQRTVQPQQGYRIIPRE